MKRVEAAINQGNCVLAVGGRALRNPDILMELRRRPVPAVALGADPVNPVQALSAEAIAPALTPGGIIVLIEPDGPTDGKALATLAGLIKGASQKPRLFVAAKAFNPFAMPMSMRLLKLELLKMRAQDFAASLPVMTEAPTAPAQAANPALNLVIGAGSSAPAGAATAQPARKDSNQPQAPRPEFILREEDSAALQGFLAEDGGPIVLVGPAGVGRRWLVEHTLDQQSGDDALTRLPDLTIARGIGADVLAARVALAAKEAGHEDFDARLRAARANPSAALTPAELSDAFVAALQHEGMKKTVLVIHHLHRLLDRRDNSFYREGRLEMMLRRALQSSLSARLIITTEAAPTFYREGDGQHMRVHTLTGIRGKELHGLFNAWHAPEFPRDRFGPISDRTHGHPLTCRSLAIVVRNGGDIDDILEHPRRFRSRDIHDLTALEKHLKKTLSKLSEGHMTQLCAAALLLEPAPAQTLQQLGINRRDRLTLLAEGLLEQTPTQGTRRYYVHPIVRSLLDNRKVVDFGVMENLGHFFLNAAETIQRNGGNATRVLALRQNGNRFLIEARRQRSTARLQYPDTDPMVDTVYSLIRRRSPRYDIARMRVNEILKGSPLHTEILLCDAELRVVEKKKVEEIQAVYDQIVASCPTPEAVHHETSFHLSRNARGKAIDALVRGIEMFPGSGRLRRRLAGLYLRQNRLANAVETLKTAADLEPMMPDNYSMLGEVYVRMGAAQWEEADQVISEARRLDPENPIHLYRAAQLLRARAIIDTEGRAQLLEQANTLLQEAIKGDQTSNRILTLSAAILLDQEGDIDLEKVGWLLKKASRRNESVENLTQRARLALRKGDFKATDRALNRAYKKDGSHHPAFSVRGDLLFAQGDIFHAMEAYKTARDRSPSVAPERAHYEARMASLLTLINAGQFTVPQTTETAEQAADGPRRESGKTIVRRTADGKIVDVHANDDTNQDALNPAEDTTAEAPVEEAVEAAAEETVEAPVEEAVEAAAEETVEAPVEEAPVEEAPVEAAVVEEAVAGDSSPSV